MRLVIPRAAPSGLVMCGRGAGAGTGDPGGVSVEMVRDLGQGRTHRPGRGSVSKLAGVLALHLVEVWDLHLERLGLMVPG